MYAKKKRNCRKIISARTMLKFQTGQPISPAFYSYISKSWYFFNKCPNL